MNGCPEWKALLSEDERVRLLDAAVRRLAAAEPPESLPERVLARLERRPAFRFSWQAALAALGLVACSLVVLERSLTKPPPAATTVPPAVLALSAWRSPTEWLLRSPTEPLRGVPRLGDRFFGTKSPGEKNAK